MSYADLLTIDERTNIRNAPLREIEYVMEDGELVARIDGTSIPVESNLDVFAAALDVPRPFANNRLRGRPETLATVLNAMREDIPEKPYQWALGEDEGGTPRVFSYGPSNKPYIPYGRIGEILSRKGMELGGEFDYRDNMGIITASMPNAARVEPREGDILRSGVRVAMTPTMFINPQVSPYSLRLICTNGMTRNVERERVHLVGNTVDEVMAELEEMADRAFERAAQLNEEFAALVNEQTNPTQAISQIAARNGFSARVTREMTRRAAALGEDEQTMYDALNVVTEVARDVESPSTRARLQSTAGRLAHESHCSSCGGVLS